MAPRDSTALLGSSYHGDRRLAYLLSNVVNPLRARYRNGDESCYR
jgi:hypothetical protein